MSSFTSIILAIMTFILSITAQFNTVKVKEEKSDFQPVLRFTVCSDTHVETFGDTPSGRIQKMLQLAYDKAEECETYNTLDAAMFCGDVTDNGTNYQFYSFASAVKSVIKDETQFLAIVAKSHDSYQGKTSRDIITEMTGVPADWHYIINGYHFIGVSTSPNEGENYSREQIEWLDGEISKAVAEDPEKPVFVTHHEHVSDTVYGSAEGEWGINVFSEVLEKYPQVVHFSGHSHYPLNDPRSITQDSFTCIGTGAIKYMEFTVDGESRIHPDNYNKAGQFWLVEVDKDSNIRLRGYSTVSRALLCEYILKNPAKEENKTYSSDSLESSTAPAFSQNAEIGVTKVGNKATVKIPAAKSTDGKIVFLYRVYSYDKNGEIIDSQWYINNYWMKPEYESVKITVKAVKGGHIEAVAENAYGMQSAPLTAEV